MNIYNPKLILAIGGLCFIIAYIAHLKSGGPIYNWFGEMHWIGQVATVGVFASIGWLIVSTLIKRR
jgi:hypothetical protein